MKNILFFFLFFLAMQPINSQHTFSIVAIDPATGKIGSAGATCLTSADCGFCGGAVIISGIVPGQGAVNAQATVCIPNINLNNALDRVELGENADEVLTWLLANDACIFGDNNSRQYGIVTLSDLNEVDAMGYTGADCLAEADHRVGPNYSVQGNILIGTSVLDDMESNFLNATGSFEQRMMAALQGANIPGADSRCLDDGISSKSSFLRIAEPDDTNGNFSVNLVVPDTNPGVDPIDSLQTLFDQLGLNSTNDPIVNVDVRVFPNPSTGAFTLSIASPLNLDLSVVVFDLQGRTILDKKVYVGQNEIPLNAQNGAYIYQLKDSEMGLIHQNTLVIQK